MDSVQVSEQENTGVDRRRGLAWRNCQQHLGASGAEWFLRFIAFSGLGTGRLFAWASLIKALLNPAGHGVCEGKLVRADISKWKQLCHSVGKTERISKGTELEFTVAQLSLKGVSRRIYVLLVFERESETLLVFTNPQPIESLAVAIRVLELATVAAEKLNLPLGQPRRSQLWVSAPEIHKEMREHLCRMGRDPQQAESTESAPAGKRRTKRLEWRAQKMVVYPDDWTCQLLPPSVLPATCEWSGGVGLRAVRQGFLDFTRKFNVAARQKPNLRGATPSILHLTRARDVAEWLSV